MTEHKIKLTREQMDKLKNEMYPELKKKERQYLDALDHARSFEDADRIFRLLLPVGIALAMAEVAIRKGEVVETEEDPDVSESKLRALIDAALDANNPEEFKRLTKELRELQSRQQK